MTRDRRREEERGDDDDEEEEEGGCLYCRVWYRYDEHDMTTIRYDLQ